MSTCFWCRRDAYLYFRPCLLYRERFGPRRNIVNMTSTFVLDSTWVFCSLYAPSNHSPCLVIAKEYYEDRLWWKILVFSNYAGHYSVQHSRILSKDNEHQRARVRHHEGSLDCAPVQRQSGLFLTLFIWSDCQFLRQLHRGRPADHEKNISGFWHKI